MASELAKRLYFLMPFDYRSLLNMPGKSLNAIAVALNAEGVPTAQGGKWYASTVAHIVRSVEIDKELLKLREDVHREIHTPTHGHCILAIYDPHLHEPVYRRDSRR
jgi:hypothetical protein